MVTYPEGYVFLVTDNQTKAKVVQVLNNESCIIEVIRKEFKGRKIVTFEEIRKKQVSFGALTEEDRARLHSKI